MQILTAPESRNRALCNILQDIKAELREVLTDIVLHTLSKCRKKGSSIIRVGSYIQLHSFAMITQLLMTGLVKQPDIKYFARLYTLWKGVDQR